MPKEVTNNLLAKLLTVENATILIGCVITASIGWANVNSRLGILETKAANERSERKEMVTAINNLNTTVAVLNNTVTDLKSHLLFVKSNAEYIKNEATSNTKTTR